MQILRYAVGLVVLALGALGGSYLWALLADEGDTDDMRITIFFENVDGLAPGADVRHRGVRVGEVRRVQLGPGGSHAEVACTLQAGVRQTLLSSSRFWIVRPRFSGIQRGATGLDTLIKDSYVSYESPPGHAPPLANGAKVVGLLAPPDAGSLAGLGERSPGDLEVAVYLAESGGLEAGSLVRYRGVPVGRVTAIRLLPDHSAVEVTARIEQRHRSAVRDRTEFWVGRPELSAHWFSGLAVEDLGTLLGGEYLSFYTRSESRSIPAPDGARFVGSIERPKFRWAAPELAEIASQTAPRPAGDPLGSALATVHLSFTETDWLTPNDHFVRRSPATVFLTRGGLGVALAPRAAVDALANVNERSPSIRDERLRVEFGDGSVHEAGQLWVDLDSGLAVVQVVAPLDRFPESPPLEFTSPAELPGAVEVLVPGSGSDLERSRAVISERLEVSGMVLEADVGLLVRDQRIIGFIARRPGDARPVAIPLDSLPEALRPTHDASASGATPND